MKVQHSRAKPLAIGLLSLTSALCAAQDAAPAAAPAIDKADSAWMIVATALVLLMTPALALFYGGMVHKKNVLNTMLMSFLMMGIISILWILVGYSIAFGQSGSGFIGNPMEFFLGKGISTSESYPHVAMTIPNALFMLFQMKFAIITPALISGAIAERVTFRGYLVLTVLWSLLIYCPLACWVWNPEGWLMKKGALDFAGGTVVHLASGVSALALVMVLGKRKNLTPPPNNITLVLLGAGLLWVGWFGFNAGSALAINDVSVNAFLTTHIAAAAAMLAWLVAEKMKNGRMSAIGGASGLVAGLVGITPAAGFVNIGGALVIGVVVGVVCFLGIQFKHKLGYDDALDVVGVHGIGGLTGAILTGVLATTEVNTAVTEAALKNGRGALIMNQVVAVVATIVFAFVGSYILAQIVAKTIGLRASDAAEDAGLDRTTHGESGYGLDDGFAHA